MQHVDTNGNIDPAVTGYAGHGLGINNPTMQNVDAREKDLQKLLGRPSLEGDDWRFYSYNGKVPKGDFDESALLGVRVKMKRSSR
jgi:hypothetical protein